MTRIEQLWATATVLLRDPDYFQSERDRVLEEHPLLNSIGLGVPKRNRSARIIRTLNDLDSLNTRERREFRKARDALRSSGTDEIGIRNTLRYFVDARISLRYRLRECSQQRRFNGPVPPKRSSYELSKDVDSFLIAHDRRPDEDASKRRKTSSGAFICASLMLGLKIWTYRNSVYPDLRIGDPWAVAGLSPRNYTSGSQRTMARFWRWVVQLDRRDPALDDFIADTTDLLYRGARLERLRFAILRADEQTRSIYQDLILEFHDGLGRSGKQNAKALSRTGSLVGEIELPDDFNEMGAEGITRLFEGKE